MASGKHILHAVTDRMILAKGYGGCNDGQSGTAHAIMGYLDAILQAYEITEDMLVLAVLLLDVARRKSLIEFLFPNRGGDSARADLYGEAEELLSSPELLAEKIITGIKEKSIRFSRDAIVDRLRDLVGGRRAELPLQVIAAFEERLAEAGALFNLTESDSDVLRIMYCIFGARNQEFGALRNNMSFNEFMVFISVATGLSEREVKRSISRCEMLYHVKINSELSALGCGDFIEMEDSVIEYLAGVCDAGLIEQYLVPDSAGAYALESFTTVPAESARLLIAMLSSDQPVNILLYGRAGTGKTEFARSIVAGARKQAFFLQYGSRRESQSVDPSKRMVALYAAVNGVSPERDVIIVDEADSILNTMNASRMPESTVEKGRLNSFLDEPKAGIIWIANTIEMAEESTLRRFSFSLYFRDFSPVERKVMWKKILERHPLKPYLPAPALESLASEFDVTTGGIACALNGAAAVFGSGAPSKAEAVKTVRELLTRHRDLVNGSYYREKHCDVETAPEPYDVKALNTDIDISPLRNHVRTFARRMKKDTAGGGYNLNILLWGTPGTGKTAFAAHLAREAGLACIVRRPSDLESMYVGQTEKNIAEAFREAEEGSAVLFIDEADSFFTARETASRSWEVSRTNEFLTQMERHRGILVCCTNLLPSMDNAAMRRFAWKVEFRTLLPEAKTGLFEKYFLRRGRKLSEAEARRIKGIPDLTPGEIRSVWQRYRTSLSGRTDYSGIIDELEKEVSYKTAGKTGKIGFL